MKGHLRGLCVVLALAVAIGFIAVVAGEAAPHPSPFKGEGRVRVASSAGERPGPSPQPSPRRGEGVPNPLSSQPGPAAPQPEPGVGPTTRPVRPDRHTIYIPYKDLRTVFEREGRGVYLPYEEFMRLWRKARGLAETPEAPVAALIASAAYTGAVKGDLAALDATYQVQVLRSGWSRLRLGLTGVAIAKATFAGEPARLVARPDGGYDLLVATKGTHNLTLSFVVPVTSQPGLKSFSFRSPRVPVSQIQLDIPEKDVKVEVQPLLAATRTPLGATATRVMAFLGSTDTVRVQWQPRPVDVTKLTPLVFATTDTHTALDDGLMRTSVTMAINVLRAPVSTFRVALPAGIRLIAIKGANLKDWRLTPEAKRQTLTVDLHAGITGAYGLTLQLERLIAADVTEVVVPEVTLLGAQRETGHVAVSTAATLRSEVRAQTNLSQMDVKELPAALRRGPNLVGYRFLKHPYDLRLGLARITPQIDVVSVNQVTIEKDRIGLFARLSYDIRKVGVFRLRVAVLAHGTAGSTALSEKPSHKAAPPAPAGKPLRGVPAGLEVVEVGRPGSISDYRLRPGGPDKPTVIEIDLPRRTMGAFVLPIRCEQKRPTLAGRVALPTVQALDVDKEDGYVAVLAPEALKVVTAEQTGVVPADREELLRQGISAADARGNALVFGVRYRRRPIAAAVDVTARKTKVTAEVLSLYDVSRDVVRATVTLRYTIRYAGIDTLTFQVPASISDGIKVTGPAIKEHKALPAAADDEWVTWQVVLQSERTGTHAVTVEYDLPVEAEKDAAAPVEVPVIRIKAADPTVERETGQIAIVKRADLGVAPAATGLETIDPRELDKALRRADVVAAYKYYSSDYALALAVKRFEFAEIATTVAAKAALESIVGKDGAVTTRARWRIRTTRRQFLEVALPTGAVISGVAVAGRPVQPQKGRDADAYLIRLGAGSASSAGAGKDLLVEVVYTLGAPNGAARLTLDAPRLPDDVPVQKLYWLLYLSGDRHVHRVKADDLGDETRWRLGWRHLWPTIRPVAGVDVDRWIRASAASAVTFEPPTDAQVFLLSGMGGSHAVTVTTADRRTVAAVVVAVLVAIGLVFALARTPVKIAAIVLLVAAAVLGAAINKVIVLEGLSAGALGIAAIIAIWLLEYVFLRIPRSVRRRRAALADDRAVILAPTSSPADEPRDEEADR